MYLSALRDEHKKLFLELALHLVAADGEYSEKEEAMMAAYCQEMQLDCDPPKTPSPLKEITEALAAECSEQEKKAIVFEAVGLAMTDGQYDKSERELICSVQEEFGLSEDFGGNCEALLNEYLDLQGRLNDLIVG